LIVFTPETRDTTYDNVIDIVEAMNKVVDRLYLSAKKLT
jgi:hypothetical protein